MINGHEERKHQLAFELQNSRVFGILLEDFFGSFLIVK